MTRDLPRLDEKRVAALFRTQGEIAAATTPQKATSAFMAFLNLFDTDTMAAGEIDLAVEARNVFYAIEWPESWRRFYFDSGLQGRDPVVSSLPLYRQAFTWSELRTSRRLSQVGSRAMQLIAQFGWSEGLVVPLPRGGTRYGLVSLAARCREFSSGEKAALTLISISYHAKLRELVATHGFAVAPLGLSDREQQCLALAATGHSDRKIAETLSIALPTAQEYFRNVRRKLKVGNRAEAVSVAISLGIISV